MDWVLDIIFKICSVFSWLFALIIVFKNRIRKNTLQKSQEEENKQIIKNKADQEAAEKELENMAKFLCDRCGKQTDVNRAVSYTMPDKTLVDLCPECHNSILERDKIIQAAEEELRLAEIKVAELRTKLHGLKNESEIIQEKAVTDNTQNSDILKSLGLEYK